MYSSELNPPSTPLPLYKTSLAISIGFVSLLLVLCLSKSFNDDIYKLEKDIVSVFPISIKNGEFEIINDNVISSNDKIINKNKEDYIHKNNINNEYLDYVKKIDEINYISYSYDISMPIISDKYKLLDNNYMKMLPSNNFIFNNYDIFISICYILRYNRYINDYWKTMRICR